MADAATGLNPLLDAVAAYGFHVVAGGVILYFVIKIGLTFTAWIAKQLNQTGHGASSKKVETERVHRSPSERLSRESLKPPSNCPGLCQNPPDPRKLRDHTLFTTGDRLLQVKLQGITCACAGRTEVFRDLCEIILRTWVRAWYDFLDDDARKTEPPDRLIRAISDLMTYWQRDLLAAMTNSGIPAVVKQVFEEWAEHRVTVLEAKTVAIAGHKAYRSNYERIASVMFLHEFVMDLVVLNMRSLVWGLNGRLDGQSYKGSTIQPSHPYDGETGAFQRPPTGGTAVHQQGSSSGYRRTRSDEVVPSEGYRRTQSTEMTLTPKTPYNFNPDDLEEPDRSEDLP